MYFSVFSSGSASVSSLFVICLVNLFIYTAYFGGKKKDLPSLSANSSANNPDLA
jgi:hypothetical protein